MIEAFGRGYGYSLQLCDILIGNSLVVFEEDVLFQEFRGAVPRPDSRNPCIKIAAASLTAELVASDMQPHGIHGHTVAFYLAPERVLDPKLSPAAMRTAVFPFPAHFQNAR